MSRKRFNKNLFRKVRWVLAGLSVAVFLVVFMYAAIQYARTSQSLHGSGAMAGTISDRPFNDMTNSGIQTRLNMSNSWFQAGLLIAAAIIGFLFAKRGETDLIVREKPEIIMGIAAVALLLTSFASHVLYLNEISYVYLLGGEVDDNSLPDILDWKINYLFTNQFSALILGTLLALITFVSAHFLKGD